MYSSALYPHAEASLEEAQQHRLDVICQKLDLKPGDHLLEIGTGWGGLALHAARHFGCKVTTTTISDAQFQEASQRVKEAGLEGQITLLTQDYRDLDGQYDKLVSIEMIEAVGHRYLPAFFEKCQSLLKPDGVMLLQAITISDQRYDSYARSVDFIQRYIFPGGCLPSNSRMLGLMARHTDFVVRDLKDFGFDYARTLKEWRQRFHHGFEGLRPHGFDERFKRLWDYYLCYCEGGFGSGPSRWCIWWPPAPVTGNALAAKPAALSRRLVGRGAGQKRLAGVGNIGAAPVAQQPAPGR